MQEDLTPKPVLSVEGLSTSFKVDGEWREVVRDLSFHVMPGETVAIVGESGSGKSVTLKSIMQLLPPRVGEIAAGYDFQEACFSAE